MYALQEKNFEERPRPFLTLETLEKIKKWSSALEPPFQHHDQMSPLPWPPIPDKSTDEAVKLLRDQFPYRCFFLKCRWAFRTKARVVHHVEIAHVDQKVDKVGIKEGARIPETANDYDSQFKLDLKDEIEILNEVLTETEVGFRPSPLRVVSIYPEEPKENQLDVVNISSCDWESKISSSLPLDVEMKNEDAVEQNEGVGVVPNNDADSESDLDEHSENASTVSTETDFATLDINIDLSQYNIGPPPDWYSN